MTKVIAFSLIVGIVSIVLELYLSFRKSEERETQQTALSGLFDSWTADSAYTAD